MFGQVLANVPARGFEAFAGEHASTRPGARRPKCLETWGRQNEASMAYKQIYYTGKLGRPNFQDFNCDIAALLLTLLQRTK